MNQDKLALSIFGMTRTEAVKRGICISCKKQMDIEKLPNYDLAEWRISGLCKDCFDMIVQE